MGLLGCCRQWRENFSGKPKFLHDKLTKEGLIKWSKEDEDRLEELKGDLANAPVLSLPDLKRPFCLFINVEQGVAYGVLAQNWARSKKPIAYLSKFLDPVSRG